MRPTSASSSPPLYLVLLSLLVVLLLSPHYGTNVVRAYDWHCQYYWRGPSADNSLSDCLKHVLDLEGGMIMPSVVPIYFTVVVFVFFPLFFFLRLCCGCCGSSKVRPATCCCNRSNEWDYVDPVVRDASYPREYVSCYKRLLVIFFVLSFGTLILVPWGTSWAMNGYKHFYHSILDIVDDVNDKVDSIEHIANTTGMSVPASDFDNAHTFADKAHHEVEHFDNKYFHSRIKPAILASYGVCIAAPLFLALGFVACCGNHRRCLPSLNMWVYWFIAIIFGLYCAACTTAGVAVMATCGEASLEHRTLPGIFQWYLKPYCAHETDYSALASAVRSAEDSLNESTNKTLNHDLDALSCSHLVRNIADEPFEKCHHFVDGFYMMAGGYALGALCLVLSILVMQKGEKVFFDPDLLPMSQVPDGRPPPPPGQMEPEFYPVVQGPPPPQVVETVVVSSPSRVAYPPRPRTPPRGWPVEEVVVGRDRPSVVRASGIVAQPPRSRSP